MKNLQRLIAIAASVALLTACSSNTTTSTAPSTSPNPSATTTGFLCLHREKSHLLGTLI